MQGAIQGMDDEARAVCGRDLNCAQGGIGAGLDKRREEGMGCGGISEGVVIARGDMHGDGEIEGGELVMDDVPFVGGLATACAERVDGGGCGLREVAGD